MTRIKFYKYKIIKDKFLIMKKSKLMRYKRTKWRASWFKDRSIVSWHHCYSFILKWLFMSERIKEGFYLKLTGRKCINMGGRKELDGLQSDRVLLLLSYIKLKSFNIRIKTLRYGILFVAQEQSLLSQLQCTIH